MSLTGRGGVPPAAEVAARLRLSGCVFAEEEAAILLATAADPGELARMIDRRAAGFPLEQVVGWAEFCGLRVAVDPGVFVPRRRTEFLVAQAVALAGAGPAVVVDLCCGSGAIGLAVAAELDDAVLHAADIDPAAVACARRNLSPVGGQVYEGDLFTALPEHLRGRIGVLAANVPYVPEDEIALLPAEAREHEPRTALDGGGDGLDVLRRVAAAAPDWLAPGGCLLSETSAGQAGAALRAIRAAGFSGRIARSEDLGATVVIGMRGSPRSQCDQAPPSPLASDRYRYGNANLGGDRSVDVR